MGEMHRVAGLEGDHFVPPTLADVCSNLIRSLKSTGKLGTEITEVQHLN